MTKCMFGNFPLKLIFFNALIWMITSVECFTLPPTKKKKKASQSDFLSVSISRPFHQQLWLIWVELTSADQHKTIETEFPQDAGEEDRTWGLERQRWLRRLSACPKVWGPELDPTASTLLKSEAWWDDLVIPWFGSRRKEDPWCQPVWPNQWATGPIEKPCLQNQGEQLLKDDMSGLHTHAHTHIHSNTHISSYIPPSTVVWLQQVPDTLKTLFSLPGKFG